VHFFVGQDGILPPIENRPSALEASPKAADFQSAAGYQPALQSSKEVGKD
jgi:hypothetical protein